MVGERAAALSGTLSAVSGLQRGRGRVAWVRAGQGTAVRSSRLLPTC